MEEIRVDEHLETDLRLADRRAKRLQDERNYGQKVDELSAICAEVQRAKRHGEQFASLHEAYAVILEEVDEVWDITRQKRMNRDVLELRKEFIQIAAMALKALGSMENFVGGNV
jgi:glutamyl-tRNA reductase